MILLVGLALANSCPPLVQPGLPPEIKASLEAVTQVPRLTFRESLVRPEVARVYKPACLSALRAQFQKGPILLESLRTYSKPIKEVGGFSKPGEVYHYTDSESLTSAFLPDEDDRAKAHEVLRQQGYQDIFNESRSLKWGNTYMTHVFWDRQALFVSTDPTSNDRFGDSLITLTLDPEARVFHYRWTAWVLSELVKSYPELNSCLSEGSSIDTILPILLEENGIALMAYTGVAPWFVLLGPGAIIGSQVKEGSFWDFLF